MDIIISLIALFISILSFVLSFLQSHDVKMTVNKIEIKNLNDSFALLFDGNNKIKIGLVNYNNRDVLLYLKEGYVEIDKHQHLIKPAYYTAKSNSVTDIQIEILSSTRGCIDNNELYLLFQYKGLLGNRKCKIRR